MHSMDYSVTSLKRKMTPQSQHVRLNTAPANMEASYLANKPLEMSAYNLPWPSVLQRTDKPQPLVERPQQSFHNSSSWSPALAEKLLQEATKEDHERRNLTMVPKETRGWMSNLSNESAVEYDQTTRLADISVDTLIEKYMRTTNSK